MQGFYNEKHRKWKLTNVEKCEKCAGRNENYDSDLELFLRFKISQKLKIEDDNFTKKYEKYKNISFNLTNSEKVIKSGVSSEFEMINFFLNQKLTLGVGFELPDLNNEVDKIYTMDYFCVPIMKGGRMWRIVTDMIECRNTIIPIDRCAWDTFGKKQNVLKCLFCTNYPFDIYPGNFIVNQNVLYLKTFMWMDKERLHVKKKTRSDNDTYAGDETKKIIMYTNESKIISWPFLLKHALQRNDCVNNLGNMAVFSSGEICTFFIDILIKKLKAKCIDNTIIQKIGDYMRNDNNINFTIEDFTVMYKNSRRVKSYKIEQIIIDENVKKVIVNTTKKKQKTSQLYNYAVKNKPEMGNFEERTIVGVINGQVEINSLSRSLMKDILSWFKYPKSKPSYAPIVEEVCHAKTR